MKTINILSILAFGLCASIMSGCTGTTSKPANQEVTAAPKDDVKMVPARVNEENNKKTVVVERDGKYYELLKEHERLCSDCDK